MNIERGKSIKKSHKTSLDERLKTAKKQCEENKKTNPTTHNEDNRQQDRGEREEREYSISGQRLVKDSVQEPISHITA